MPEKKDIFESFPNANQGQQIYFSGNMSKPSSKQLWNTTKIYNLELISEMKKEEGGKERGQSCTPVVRSYLTIHWNLEKGKFLKIVNQD